MYGLMFSQLQTIEYTFKISSFTLGFTLFSFWSINEVEMTFKATFVVEIKWFDTRLTFLNLKHDKVCST